MHRSATPSASSPAGLAAQARGNAQTTQSRRLTAVDLFCGAGGTSVGLKQAGFTVHGAVDVEPLATDAYRTNHPEVRVWEQDVRTLPPEDLAAELGLDIGALDLLAGCPPCQGFSTVKTRRQSTSVSDPRNSLVHLFGKYVEALRPRAVLMENVPALAKDIRFARLRGHLERLGYFVEMEILDAADFGVPQRRRRLVMLATIERSTQLVRSTAARATVRDAIHHLPLPSASADPLHNHGEKRSPAIRARIELVPADGGSFRLLKGIEQLACHTPTESRPKPGFFDVYGRMSWDQPAPTLTGGCINPSKGRYLHPDQHRSITLREAALLQGFPPDYKLPLSRGKYKAAELIGNALPPAMIFAQASAVARALQQYTKLLVA